MDHFHKPAFDPRDNHNDLYTCVIVDKERLTPCMANCMIEWNNRAGLICLLNSTMKKILGFMCILAIKDNQV